MRNFEIVGKIKELQSKLADVKTEENGLHVQMKMKITEAKAVQGERDRLNDEVKELSQKPRNILEERKDIWDSIKGTNEEKKKIFKEMQPQLQKIGELRKVRDEYNRASRGTMEKLHDYLTSTMEPLIKSDINLKNELYMYQFLFELRDRIITKREADRIHREIVRIKEEELSKFNRTLGALEGQIGEMKEKSHTNLKLARELWSERDGVRDIAQKRHNEYLELNRQIKEIKKKIDTVKKERWGIINEIDQWRNEFKKSDKERKDADRGRRLKDAMEKFRNGESLSLDEMGLLLEAGELGDEK